MHVFMFVVNILMQKACSSTRKMKKNAFLPSSEHKLQAGYNFLNLSKVNLLQIYQFLYFKVVSDAMHSI